MLATSRFIVSNLISMAVTEPELKINKLRTFSIMDPKSGADGGLSSIKLFRSGNWISQAYNKFYISIKRKQRSPRKSRYLARKTLSILKSSLFVFSWGWYWLEKKLIDLLVKTFMKYCRVYLIFRCWGLDCILKKNPFL